MASFSIPGFFCELDQMYSDLGFNDKEGGDIKARVRSRRSSIKSNGSYKITACKKCKRHGSGITLYNHENGKLCKDCFLEMKKLQKEEEEGK